MSNDSAENEKTDGATPDPDEPCFAKVTAGVYRAADPEVIWRAFQYAIRHRLPGENPMIALMFVRIVETFPAVREHLESVAPSASELERSALKMVLDPPEQLRNAAYLPDKVESPGELDLCWSEFLVTGDIEVVKKMVAVLDRPDQTRSFLNTVLADESDGDTGNCDEGNGTTPDPEEQTRFSINEEDRAQFAQVGIMIGRRDDTGPFVVLSPGDLDFLLWIGLKTQNAACTKVLQAMDEATQVHMSTKGAALWSLQANAAQHGTVRLLCIDEAKQPGFGRSLLNVE